jgi:HK97 family phage major capsid protein
VLPKVLRGGEQRLDASEKKSLSAFNFHGSGLLLPPEDMGRTLDCLVAPNQISGLVDQVTTSAPSVRFLIETPRMAVGGWSCDASCWANNQQPEIAAGLGTLEIKPEPIRYVACATSDLLSDAAFNVEQWLFRKVSDGFAVVINEALLGGDGAGKPMGLLHPISGIPICEAAAEPGTFSWQDLVQLKMEVPEAWWPDSVFVMNQRTAALLFTMSDALTRPLFGTLVEGQPGFQFAGSRIVIVSQMPDVNAGAVPILFGNLRRTYTMVTRKAVTLIVDPYSAGFCTLFRFEARIGGSTTCPNASRLLRIR